MVIRILFLFFLFCLTSCSSTLSHKESIPSSSEKGVQQVALLLPLNGNLEKRAQTVRDGFFAAYYQSPAKNSVNVINTGAGDMPKIYEGAYEKGANFIVGPLEKNQVQVISNRKKLPVTTLTLNYTEGKLPRRMIQFGLSPFDEAVQVVARAKREGHQKALIIVSGDSWGRKLGVALSTQWIQVGGSVVATMPMNQGKNSVDQLQSVVPGVGRANPPKKPEFDVVLLAALPDQARSVVSMLRFYGLGQIPIYATSSVYSGVPSSADKELEGVRFCDIPWVVNPTADMIRAAQQIRTLHPEADIRLYALGVDAYRLIDEIPSLSASPNASYRGLTGILSLRDQRINRVLSWGQFVNGQVVPLS